MDASKMLHDRLNKYGGGGAPKSLLTPQRRPGASGGLAPLPQPPPPVLQSPLRPKRGKSDAALSSSSFHDAASLGGSLRSSGSKTAFGIGADPLVAAPMPFAKMARTAPLPAPVAMAAGASSASVPAPADTKAADSGEGAVKRDPFWFIRMLRTELAEHEFAYMNVADSQGTTWDPYDLRIVPYNEVNPEDHYTISEAGVTHVSKKGKADIAEFTPLDQWEKECAQFKEVMEIPFFKRYQSWKAYTSWKGTLKKDKMTASANVLTNHLFVLNSTFQPSLLRVRELCVQLSRTKLHKIKQGSTYTLEAFVEAQEQHKEDTVQLLHEFFDQVREAVQSACDMALARFEAEVNGPDAAAAAGGQTTPRAGATRGGEQQVKRSFLQQAQLRSVCKKITNYIRVVDYIVLSTLHQLLMSSLNDLLWMFESVTPGYVEPPEEGGEEEEENALVAPGNGKKPSKNQPLFEVSIYFQVRPSPHRACVRARAVRACVRACVRCPRLACACATCARRLWHARQRALAARARPALAPSVVTCLTSPLLPPLLCPRRPTRSSSHRRATSLPTGSTRPSASSSTCSRWWARSSPTRRSSGTRSR